MTASIQALPTIATDSIAARIAGLQSQAKALAEDLLAERLKAAHEAALGLSDAATFEPLHPAIRDRLRRVGAQLAAEIDSINSQRMRSGG